MLVREDNSPRLQWPLGVIVELFPGKDGIIRSVKVKTAKGVISRPVQKLHNLELSSAGEDATTDEAHSPLPPTDAFPAYAQGSDEAHSMTPSSTYVSRTGRIVKPPQRLNM